MTFSAVLEGIPLGWRAHHANVFFPLGCSKTFRMTFVHLWLGVGVTAVMCMAQSAPRFCFRGRNSESVWSREREQKNTGGLSRQGAVSILVR